jgi:CRISPR-associated endonuclease/helicase Cas3
MICAHSRNLLGERHDLVAHLRAVAARATEFGAAFGSPDPAYWLGLWHDVGKFHADFQTYLDACDAHPAGRGRGPDHKAAGVLLALQWAPPLALLVQGHHGGLHSREEFKQWLQPLQQGAAARAALERARAAMADLEPTARVPLPGHVERDFVAADLYLRLLFSALVDADYLDTEQHFAPEQAARRRPGASAPRLWERLAADQAARFGLPSDPLGAARHEIYQDCVAAAEQPSGLFRLTVPTGGGKTRSALAFALRHALRHGHERVIVAVPFLTITEQTAQVYRDIFGDGSADQPVVLEHHSGALGDSGEGDDFLPARVWARLAAENWDAPVIVTTTVQLFESLFGRRTSTSRKVHRLARSVIILDEAQSLPTDLLEPILDALRELCTHYGTTVVLSTATQPAFEAIAPFKVLDATEIVRAPARHFAALRRVQYEWRTESAVTWEEVAGWMRAEPRALAVVNTKRDALALLDALRDPDALHLSTLLCGAHRREVIAAVRARLATGAPCRLVATQVVEAGVDLDFPLVLRALGPLDGIIQAAGRCNREARLPENGRVIVFRPAAGGLPLGYYQKATGITEELVAAGPLDLDDPATSRAYFQRLYGTRDPDPHSIQRLRGELLFPEVARSFRMIDDADTLTVVVPYGTLEQQTQVGTWLAELRQGDPRRGAYGRGVLRALQPYMVTVRKREAARHEQRGLLAPVTEGVGEWQGRYDRVRGLVPEDRDADTFVI